MRVRILTDGGYDLIHDEIGTIQNARKEKYVYKVYINNQEYVFYPDEVEVIQDHIYFLELAEDKAAIKILVISAIVTILCIATIFYVIF